ncbi:MAG: flagellar filament capping protein FliD [Ignavibacteriales bacterium]
MASIMNLNMYNTLFSSSANNISSNPLSNLIYGGIVVSRYSEKLASALKSSLSASLSSLNSSAYELKSASQNLIESNRSSSFNSRTFSSDNTSITGSAKQGAKTQTYNISVSQVAKSQVNKGLALDSNSETSLSEGLNSIKISSEDKDSIVSFNIKEGQTNKEALSTMADAINKSDSGVTAKVINDEKTQTSYLEITGKETGEKNTFSVSDVSGGVLSNTGIDKIATEAQDAVYKIGEKEYISSSNNISLDNGKINVTLKGVTEEDAEIKIEEDSKAVVNGIDSFVKSFNETLDTSMSSDSILSQKLGSELKSIVSSKQGSLLSIGINVENDGSLKIDEEKLSKAMKDDPDKVKRVIGGIDGIASKTKSLSDRLLASSAIGNTLLGSDLNSFSYLKNANKNSYLKNQSAGLFVNMLL